MRGQLYDVGLLTQKWFKVLLGQILEAQTNEP